MRILFIAQQFPYPPTDGNRWKLYHLLSHVAQNHNCDLLCFGESGDLARVPEFERSLPKLSVLGVFEEAKSWIRAKQIFAYLFRDRLPSSLRWESRIFSEAVSRAVQTGAYDLVHFEFINTLSYLEQAGPLPKVISLNDSMTLRYLLRSREDDSLLRRIKWRLLSRKYAEHEKRLSPSFQAVHVVSTRDADLLTGPLGLDNVVVIDQAVDPVYFTLPGKKTNFKKEIRLFAPGSLLESYIRLPLLAYLGSHWPRLIEKYPQARMTVLGRHASRSDEKFLKDLPNVDFLPWVEDYPKLLSDADILLLFDKGGAGIKNRPLQGFAAGKPTVGLPDAFTGLNVKDGLHCLIAEEVGQLNAKIISLIEDPTLAEKLEANARELASSRYTRTEMGRRWECLYEKLVMGRDIDRYTGPPS